MDGSLNATRRTARQTIVTVCVFHTSFFIGNVCTITNYVLQVMSCQYGVDLRQKPGVFMKTYGEVKCHIVDAEFAKLSGTAKPDAAVNVILVATSIP